MNKFHQQIISEFKKASGDKSLHSGKDSYLLSGHFYYLIRNPRKNQIAFEWFKKHQEIKLEEFIQLLDSLYKGKSYEEKTITGEFLRLFPKFRVILPLSKLEEWLDQLNGWAEDDSTCQGRFGAIEILANWIDWKRLLQNLSVDKNINKRRASIVLLITPVSQSSDSRLSDLAFASVNQLKTEKEIIITKAISWVLRSLVKHHRREVEKYLQDNIDSLPKVAILETKRKLTTGKK